MKCDIVCEIHSMSKIIMGTVNNESDIHRGEARILEPVAHFSFAPRGSLDKFCAYKSNSVCVHLHKTVLRYQFPLKSS